MSSVAPQRLAKGRILLVDDDEDLRVVMAMGLSGAGYEVDPVADGLEALSWLKQHYYDLVISDLSMPELDGPGLYLEMTRQWPVSTPRVLFISGFVDTSEYVGFLNATNHPVLVKPFALDELRRLVGRLLEA